MCDIRALLLACVVLASISLTACEAKLPPTRDKRIEVMLGETKVVLHVFGTGHKGPLLVRVHEDETTAQVVALKAVQEKKARFVDLEHGGRRFVHFVLKGKKYAFDPNRIFSPRGIAATLRTVGKSDSPEARKQVARLATAILKECGTNGPVVAMHNNRGGTDTMGNPRYGLSWYEKGGASFLGMHTEVARMNANDQSFIVVTDEDAFESLAESGQNVVFQNPVRDIDDGSMSYYFGRQKRLYFNIEAGYGDEAGQWRSLQSVFSFIGYGTQPEPLK